MVNLPQNVACQFPEKFCELFEFNTFATDPYDSSNVFQPQANLGYSDRVSKSNFKEDGEYSRNDFANSHPLQRATQSSKHSMPPNRQYSHSFRTVIADCENSIWANFQFSDINTHYWFSMWWNVERYNYYYCNHSPVDISVEVPNVIKEFQKLKLNKLN